MTALSDLTWNSLNIITPLEKTEIALIGPDQRRLNVLEKKSLTISYQGQSCNQGTYVHHQRHEKQSARFTAIRKLSMLSHVCTIEKYHFTIYPALFTGLGTLAQAYTIKLKPNHKPFSLNIPLPLRSKVQSELQRVQSMGVI